MKRTVVVSRATLIVVTLSIALVAAAVVWPKILKPPTAEAEADPGPVAAGFVSAFYTVDYRNRQAWLDKLRPLATAEGQKLLEQGIAVVLWPELMNAQTVVLAQQISANDTGLAVEGTSQVGGGSAWQARSVAVTLAEDVAWPGMRHNEFTAYVMLRQDAGQWKFATFLGQAQINELRQSVGTNP